MAVKNQTELLNALENNLYDDILATSECSWLDFKQSIYGTENGKPNKLSQSGKSELCKDVAAFANHRGGVILLGVKEALSPTAGTSVADELKPLSIASVDLAHYKQVLRDQIFPLIEHIEMKWYPAESGKGLLAIIIPKSAAKLHILRQYYDEEGRKMRGLEIPVRADDQTYWHTAESLSQLINKQAQAPKQATSSAPRKSSLLNQIPPEVMQRMHEQHAKEKQAAEKESQSIRSQVIEMKDWSAAPILMLQAVPLSGKERLDNFYDKIKQSFADTKPVRGMGFNLNSLGYESDTVDGAFIKTGVREGAIRLDPNGTLTLGLVASPNFLGWAMNKDVTDASMIKLNSIVLVEIIFEFTKFVEEILEPAGLTNWEYCLDIRNFKAHNVTLYSGRPGGFFDNLSHASKDEYTKVLPRDADYSHATFKILTEVYAFFTLPDSSIPYVNNKQVTKESILAIDASGR